MRIGVLVLTLTLIGGAVSAQQPAPAAAAGAAGAMKLFASAADVTALAAKARSERKEGQGLVSLPILQLAPYNASLEYRSAVANAALHEKEAEMFYVIDGAATIVTGGTLTGETRTNAENRTGTGIANGMSRRIAKGDFVMVPENTPHWFSAIEGTVTLMSIHLPRAGGTNR